MQLLKRESEETELYHSLPKYNGGVMSWRCIALYIKEILVQIPTPLINIISKYIGGASFHEHSPMTFPMSIDRLSNHHRCDSCEDQGDQLAVYGCRSFNHSKSRWNGTIDTWTRWDGSITIAICNLCWPYNMTEWLDGGNFIKWNNFYKKNMSDSKHLQKITSGIVGSVEISVFPDFWFVPQLHSRRA